MTDEERKIEIIKDACESALFFITLTNQGVPKIEAAQLTGTWLLSQRLKDHDKGEEWKGEG